MGLFIVLGALAFLTGVGVAAINSRQLRSGLVVLLCAVYVAMLGCWAASWVAHLFLTRDAELTLRAGGLFAPALALAILGWAAWSPRTRLKFWVAVIGMMVGAVAFNSLGPVRAWSDRQFVRRNRGALDSLATDILAYGRVRQMSHYFPTINSTPIRISESENRPDRPIAAAVLARDSISPATYQDYSRRLAALNFQGFSLYSEGIIFQRDRDSGVLYQLPDRPPLGLGRQPGRYGVSVVRVLGSGWYYIAR